MPPVLGNPLSSVAELLDAHSGRVLVALAGLPGGGKSTAATYLAAAVNRRMGPGTAVALGMDGFHLPKAALRAMPDPEAAFSRRGAPWTFDVLGLAGRLGQLRTGYRQDAVAWPEFEHAVGDPVENATLVAPEVRLVIVEGLYLLCRQQAWSRVSESFEAGWYLDTPLETALDRLIKRHQAAWNISRDEALERVARNDRLNALIVRDTRSAASALLPDQPLEFWSSLA